MLAEYRFTSSRPDVADFVEVSPTSSNPRAVFLDSEGKPVPDPHSGLLCAFNAGTTTVTIEAGGLAYSIPVTVQKGSVQRPCGTVPLLEKPTPVAKLVVPPPPPPPGPSPTFSQPHGTLPPPAAPTPAALPAAPPVPAPLPAPHPAPHPAPKPPIQSAPPPFVPVPLTMTPVVLIVPPPPAPAVEPTPPSGTSPVTQPAVSPKSEEEDEAAIQHVHHFAAKDPTTTGRPVATRVPGGGPGTPVLLLALLGIGALSGSVFARRRPRPVPAHARQPASRRHHR
jgi:hypothetical protein